MPLNDTFGDSNHAEQILQKHFTKTSSPVSLVSGAGPHPKSPSGRLISTIWWLFTIVLLACYFSSFSFMMYSSNKQMSIQSFEDLANQDVLDYGTVKSGATMMFFKVL